MAKTTDITNCGYWLYLGENDVPKKSGSMKPIDPEQLDFDGEPLAQYTESYSTPRILTRAEKGQALTHLEMDFNLASLFHKLNTSSVGSEFTIDEDASTTDPDKPERVPYLKLETSTNAYNGQYELDLSMYSDGGVYGAGANNKEVFGPYLIPNGAKLDKFYERTKAASPITGEFIYTYKLNANPQATSSLVGNADSVPTFDIYIPLTKDRSSGLYTLLREDRVFYRRTQDGDTITFTPFVSPGPEAYGPVESETGYGTDIYFERHKPTRQEEHGGLFTTFSYAPVKNGTSSIIQNPFQTIKTQHTTDEIRYKLANEQIPGTLDIREDFNVTGSAFVAEDLFVTGSIHVAESVTITGSLILKNDIVVVGSQNVSEDISVGKSLHVQESADVQGNLTIDQDTETETLKVNDTTTLGGTLQVTKTSTFDGDVYIKGNLYVDGKIQGTLANEAYNSKDNPGYALEYTRFGTQDTGSQSDERLKRNLGYLLNPLSKVRQIGGYNFQWAEEAEKGGWDVGLVAQEVQKVLPEAVSRGSDGYLRLDYEKVIPLLVEAVKELANEVEWLRDEVRNR